MADDIVDRSTLSNGDFVSLFVQSAGGVASVDLLSSKEISVFQPTKLQQEHQKATQQQGDSTNATYSSSSTADATSTKADTAPTTIPNFEQACIFQIKAVTDLPEGASLKYGDVVRIIHRSTQRSITRQTRAVGGVYSVALDATSAGASHFRLLPRFKIRAIGDPVLLNDQVVFQNELILDGNRTFLTSSSSLDQSKVLLACGPSETSGIRIRLFAPYNVSGEAFIHVLKGGDFVRLYHHEANGFLVVARQIGDGDEDDFLGHDNTVCLRAIGAGNQPGDYHDASSIWQVELEDTQRRGGRPVLWTDHVRLKNVLTDQYLDASAITSTGAMAPAKKKSASGLFSLLESTHAAEQESEDSATAAAVAIMSRQEDLRIPYSAFFYVRGSGQYLHVNTDEAAVDENQQGDDTTFVRSVLVQQRRDEDAFSLHSVHQQDIRDFYFALGHAKILAQLAEERVLSDVCSPRHGELFKRARNSIQALIQFCSEDKIEDGQDEVGRTNTLHQNILFDLQVHTPLMTVVSVPFQGAHCADWGKGWRTRLAQPKCRRFNKLCRDIYRLISYLCHGNVHVGLVMADAYLTDMVNQCRLISCIDNIHWHIADTLDNIVRNNHILLNRVTKRSVNLYISLIHEAHTMSDLEQYLGLLASLCSVDGSAIPSIQNIIRELTLAPDAPAADILPVTTIDSDGNMTISTRVPTRGKPFHQWRVVTMPLQEYLKDQDHLEYFDSMLQLYAQLCLEGNCQDELRDARRAPYPMIMGVLQSSLPAHIKARFCTLLVNLYIDGDDLPEVDHSNRRWNDLANHKSHAKLRAVADRLFRVDEVVNWVEAYLSQKGLLSYTTGYYSGADSKRPEIAELKQAEVQANMLTEQVLRLCLAMVNRGLYNDVEARQQLTRRLVVLLMRSHPSDTDDLTPTAALDVVVRAKTVLCRILDACVDVHLDDIVTQLLHAYKKECEQNKRKGRKRRQQQQEQQQQQQQQQGDEGGADLQQQQSTRSLLDIDIIKQTGDNHHFLEYQGFTRKQAAHLLLALTVYPSDGLRVAALNLLLRNFNIKGCLLARLSNVVVISDSRDEATLEHLEELMLILKQQDNDDLPTVARNLTKDIQWMCAECVTVNDKPASDFLNNPAAITAATAATTTAAAAAAAPGATTTTTAARAAAPGATRGGGRRGALPWNQPDVVVEPQHGRQEMMRNASAYKAVLNLVQQRLSGATFKKALESERVQEFFGSCFEFLAFFCWDNRNNQELLSHPRNIAFFVEACTYGIHAERVLHRIFDGQPELIEEHVVGEGNVDPLLTCFMQEPRCRTVAFVQLLETLVAPAGTPSRDMQEAIGEKLLGAEEDKAYLYPAHTAGVHFVAHLVATYTKAGQDLHGSIPTLNTIGSVLSRKEERLCAYFEQLLSLLATLARANSKIGTLVSKLVPLPVLVQPFVNGAALPVTLKARLLTLMRDVYLTEESLEAELEPSDEVGAESAHGSGDAENDNVDTWEMLCIPLATELQSLASVHCSITTLDKYLFESLLPTALNVCRALSRHVLNDPSMQALAGPCSRLLTAMLDALRQRRNVVEADMSCAVVHGHRMLTARVLDQTLDLSVLEVDGDIHARIITEQRFYSRASMQVESSSGPGQTRAAWKANAETARLDRFRGRVRRLLAKSSKRPTLPWMRFMQAELSFGGMWGLIDVVRSGLLGEIEEDQEELEALEEKLRDERGEMPTQGLLDAVRAEERQSRRQQGNVSSRSVAAGFLDTLARPTVKDVTVDVQQCLSRIIAFGDDPNTIDAPEDSQEHGGAGGGGGDGFQNVDEEEVEDVMLGFLGMLCSLLTSPKKTAASNEEATSIASCLLSMGAADMVLHLLDSDDRRLVLMACQLGWQLLKATPRVFEVNDEPDAAADRQGPSGVSGNRSLCAQEVFYRALESGPKAARGMAALHRHLQGMVTDLAEREREGPLQRLKRNQDSEDLDMAIGTRVLGFIEATCDGCYRDMQNLLRSAEGQGTAVVSEVGRLVQGMDHIVRAKSSAPIGSSCEEGKPDAVLHLHNDLRREANDITFMQQLFGALGALASGPNRDNQTLILQHKATKSVLLFLQYLNDPDAQHAPRRSVPSHAESHSGLKRSSTIHRNENVNLFTLNAQCDEALETLDSWCDHFGIDRNALFDDSEQKRGMFGLGGGPQTQRKRSSKLSTLIRGPSVMAENEGVEELELEDAHDDSLLDDEGDSDVDNAGGGEEGGEEDEEVDYDYGDGADGNNTSADGNSAAAEEKKPKRQGSFAAGLGFGAAFASGIRAVSGAGRDNNGDDEDDIAQARALLTSEHLMAARGARQLAEALDVLDEQCEAAVLQFLLSVLEGRLKKDSVLDVLCVQLFPENAGAQGTDFKQCAMFRMLNEHYVSARQQRRKNKNERNQAFEAVSLVPKQAQFHDEDVALLYYMMMRMLSELADAQGSRVARLLMAWEDKAAPSIRQRVARVELVHNGSLQPVYMQVPDVVRQTKDRLQVRQLRSAMINNSVLLTPEQRLHTFFDEAPLLIRVMEFENKAGSYWLSRIVSHQRVLLLCCFLLALFINGWVVFGPPPKRPEDQAIPRTAATVHTALAALIIAGQSLAPLRVDIQRWHEASEGLSLTRKILLFPIHWVFHASYTYYVLYLILSAVGISHFQFFCFHLFDVVLRVEVMTLVLRAVRVNLSKLIGTFVLTFFIIYALTLIGREAFAGKYEFPDSAAACRRDQPLSECLKDHLYYGFYSSPVFGSEASTWEFVYALFYFLVIVLVMAAIVSGIIIDSFGEYRAETEAIAAEKESRCFVCNFNRDQIQASDDTGFEGHVIKDHNVWNYIWLILRVLEKRRTHKPLTGVEIEIARQWDTTNTIGPMMPVNKALCFDTDDVHVEADVQQLAFAFNQFAASTEKALQNILAQLSALKTGRMR